jgi:uncharacterized protein YkwD
MVLAGLAAVAPGLNGVAQADTRVSRVIELTNEARVAAGLGRLVPSAELSQAAQAYAEVLAGGDCFGHACGPQADLRSRVEQSGYTGWTRLGENIAAGQRSPEEVVDAWMASPGHRANMLNPAFGEIGVGVVSRGRTRLYWVQIFGARRETASTTRRAPGSALSLPTATGESPAPEPTPPPETFPAQESPQEGPADPEPV